MIALKLYIADATDAAVTSFLQIMRCLNALSANKLMTVSDSVFWKFPNDVKNMFMRSELVILIADVVSFSANFVFNAKSLKN